MPFTFNVFRNPLHRTAVILTLLLSDGGIRAQSVFADPPSPSSPAQVERGREAYALACVVCHGADLDGSPFGPALAGAAFEGRWRGRPHAEFSRQLRTTMPPGRAGTVSSETYADIEAYLLAGNSIAAATPAAPVRARSSAPPAAPVLTDTRQQATIAARTAKLASLPPVTAERLRNPPAADWLAWRRGYDATGFSPLKAIHRGNVAKLRGAWSWSLPDSANEITPLVHAGVLFIYSGAVVQALDAATGDLLWQYQRQLPPGAGGARTARMKSLAIAGERLFAPTVDGHVVALDMRSGEPLWEHSLLPPPDPQTGRPTAGGLTLSGGPIVVRDTVILGVSLGNNYGGGCYIVGLDATTGAERWRFHTIARPGTPDGDSWNDAPLHERYGGGVWTVGSHDPALDLVYFGIGNTYTTATLQQPRPGAAGLSRNDGLYTGATVALRPETGELVWFFQHQHRDLWDMDWAFEHSVHTLPVDGQPRRVVLTANKGAIFDVMDAATGKYLFSKDLGMQNLVTAIDPVTGRKSTDPALEPEAGVSKMLCPSSYGARNWPATALNPATHVVFLPMVESCAEFTYTPRTPERIAAGGRDVHFTARRPPDSDGNAGRFTAVDLARREVIWTHRQRMPFVSAALVTAGGLVFAGDIDRHFYAFDQRSGRVLWRTRLPAAPDSHPITYAVAGRQYVAVVAGGGSPLVANHRSQVPELPAGAGGVTLLVFELPTR